MIDADGRLCPQDSWPRCPWCKGKRVYNPLKRGGRPWCKGCNAVLGMPVEEAQPAAPVAR